MGPEFEKGDGRLRPSLQQRLPGAEGPPEGCSTAPRHAACGGPIPSRATSYFLQIQIKIAAVIQKWGRAWRRAPKKRRTVLPGPRHSFARDGEDTSRSGSVLRAYCILDAELSDVIVFAAPRSTPAAARARAPPLLRSNTLNFMALQIRVGA